MLLDEHQIITPGFIMILYDRCSSCSFTKYCNVAKMGPYTTVLHTSFWYYTVKETSLTWFAAFMCAFAICCRLNINLSRNSNNNGGRLQKKKQSSNRSLIQKFSTSYGLEFYSYSHFSSPCHVAGKIMSILAAIDCMSLLFVSLLFT